MSLFRRLWSALTAPRSFTVLNRHTVFQSLLTLLAFCFLAGIVSSVRMAILLYSATPNAEVVIEDINEGLYQLYPMDLELRIKDGILSVNKETPYSIEVPEAWRPYAEKLMDATVLPNLVSIDPAASVEDYYDYNALVLLTDSSLVYPSRSHTYKTENGAEKNVPEMSFVRYDQDLQSANMTLDRAKYDTFMDALIPMIQRVPGLLSVTVVVVIVIAPWFIAFFSFISTLFYLVFATFLLWILSKIMGWKVTYGSLYKLGLYGVMLPMLLKLIASTLSFSPPLFIFTMVYMIWMFCVLRMNTAITGKKVVKKVMTKKKKRK